MSRIRKDFDICYPDTNEGWYMKNPPGWIHKRIDTGDTILQIQEKQWGDQLGYDVLLHTPGAGHCYTHFCTKIFIDCLLVEDISKLQLPI